jgi:hypothetical protein
MTEPPWWLAIDLTVIVTSAILIGIAFSMAGVSGMVDRIRIIPHEAVSRCGSFEVRFPDGRQQIRSAMRAGPLAAAALMMLQ